MFRTELPLTPHPQQLPHSARILTIGSCFSDSIGRRLLDYKVAALVNPFGTVFNPVSACRLLRAAAGEDMDWQQHVVEARGRWQSYDLHADIGADTPVDLLQRIQGIVRETGVFLATADVVVLTLGTSFAYRLRETQEIISNCHKVPAEKFEKELLTADEIIAAVAETHAYLRRINPRLRFILTVSPVRHLKETLALSSVSKSMLRVACHYLSELLPDVAYFPAYELLLDDLRDYRFYAADMLHPSEVAEQYIWERFTRTYFDGAFGRFKKEWEGIRQALGHRPLHAAAPEHRQFLENTLARLQRISSQADVRMELLHIERELAALPVPPLPPAPEAEEEDDEERIDIGEGSEIMESSSEATLVRLGAGMLVEAEESTEETATTEVNPDDAYETAYTASILDGEDEEEEIEAEETIAGVTIEVGESPVRKKKRRSRGGAKRTKKKHARLAAEAAALAGEVATDVSHIAEAPTPSVEEATPEADSINYITEAELFNNSQAMPLENAVIPEQPAATPDEPGDTPPQEEEAEPAPSPYERSNRRQRPPRRQDRAGRKTSRPVLYASGEETETGYTDAAADSNSLADVVAEVVPVAPLAEAAMPVVEADQPATLDNKSLRPPRNRGKARASRLAQAAETAAGEVSTNPETTPSATPEQALTEPVAEQPSASSTPRRSPQRSSRRSQAPQVAAETTTEAPTPTDNSAADTPLPPKRTTRRTKAPAVTPEEPATPAKELVAEPKKKPSRSRKAAPLLPVEVNAPSPVAETPAEPEPTDATPAPKRRPRPPRRKPASDNQPE
ncbi:GSCFA domain-containing protein [Hymenobacter sp. AT01-02]|uniref:GSCFA domain-containing protein n=1 Tax=Hymenobacter sp. AT01-02 TaxID=1571877 RepID=UPI00092F188C|nr:GSCFA domain-containing protein [Hymenobacter sp. AT01-02]